MHGGRETIVAFGLMSLHGLLYPEKAWLRSASVPFTCLPVYKRYQK